MSIIEWNCSALGIYHLAPESGAMKTITAQPNRPHLLNARATPFPDDRPICLLTHPALTSTDSLCQAIFAVHFPDLTVIILAHPNRPPTHAFHIL